jgi:hypothetical protein
MVLLEQQTQAVAAAALQTAEPPQAALAAQVLL